MNLASTITQWRTRALAYWAARTDQERKLLTVGAAVVLLALAWLLLVSPALEGRARLRKSLPQLRQQQAQLEAMAREANELKAQPAAQVVPMTRESLTASLGASGLTATLSTAGQNAQLQLKGASFANLVMWLDAQRRESRIAVQDAVFTALPTVGQVDANLTLHQDSGEQAGAR